LKLEILNDSLVPLNLEQLGHCKDEVHTIFLVILSDVFDDFLHHKLLKEVLVVTSPLANG